MLNWLLSRPLQIKFFVSTVLFVSIALLLIMFNVVQVLNQFLSHHIEEDMQQRTHILAMTLMVGPAAHKQADLDRLLQDVMQMHGYCYLGVYNAAGKTLSAVGDSKAPGCFAGAIPLIHDGAHFGMLHYGVETGFLDALKQDLRKKLQAIALLGLLLGSLLYYLLVRRLVKPLREITQASEQMAHGNLNAAMPANLPQDELGKLAAAFNEMAESLRQRVHTQHRYAHDLYAEQARLNALFSILPVGVMFVDPARQVQYINLECRRLWGLPEDVDYVGKLDSDLMAHAHDMLEDPDYFAQQVAAALKDYGVSPPYDTRLSNGYVIRSRSCVVPDAAGERYIGRVWMFEDVSGEHDRLHAAHSLAERDALTGLYNRRRFEEDFERMFAHAKRDGCRLTLLYFDLDDFKQINDNRGHHCGDTVLKAVAQALHLQARRNETVYRLGGDEFAILVGDAELRQAEALARRVVSTIAQLHPQNAGSILQVSCSMGIALLDGAAPPASPTELMQRADIAMYQAKHSGKNRWHVFDPAHPLDLGKDSR
jgi:diguanylate cyclase (GGDEF)-like protein